MANFDIYSFLDYFCESFGFSMIVFGVMLAIIFKFLKILKIKYKYVYIALFVLYFLICIFIGGITSLFGFAYH